MGKSSMGKSGKIGVTVDSVVCFHVCGELDHTILITNQPMLLLVTDVCLPSRVEKSISPLIFQMPHCSCKAHLQVWADQLLDKGLFGQKMCPSPGSV